jgi:2-polyprenyl-3-methyl-5-hydroxy-6-metoxy-1,4-benzoquinol methylase
MIAAAAEHSSRHIRYHAGGLKDLEKVTGKYDVITALMVFPFIKDLEAYIPLFSRLLVERGTIIFAVYNPDFVESCTDGFRKVHRAGVTAVASLAFGGGARIDAYVRDKDCYRKLFEKHGFEYVSAHYPPFTPAFVEKYDWTLPTDDAKYLIMSLRKKPTRVS